MENMVTIIYIYLSIVTILETFISIEFISGDNIWRPSDIYNKNKINKFWCWFIFIIVRIISPAITIFLYGIPIILWIIYALGCYMNNKYYTRRKSK